MKKTKTEYLSSNLKLSAISSATLSAALFAAAAFLLLGGALWEYLSPFALRLCLCVSGVLLFLLAFFMDGQKRRQQTDFANEICRTLDALMDGMPCGYTLTDEVRPFRRNMHDGMPCGCALYEDSQISKVQGRLLQYHERMQEGIQASAADKQTIQELVSDISHQVKTPIANLMMFTDILKRRELSEEKRAEFLAVMETQVSKLDFLMQSLIKMSRLETGTFALHMESGRLHETIARAVSTVWAKAEQKNISIDVDCSERTCVRHDAKWTAEAIGNLLDNAVKYTPEGGAVRVSVRPWQFFTRIDVSDTGMGIAAEHYHDVFKRFCRGPEAAGAEGVGLGLYLARGIITRQKGYVSIKSDVGKGTVVSVFLLN